jgi:malonate-semialdehyde dehydrogenase (acetylating)/methylmalonate-semialdehyde dehydrogenase
LFAEAGLPPGVFSVLHGDRATVEGLLDHPAVAAASFVGSTPVARAVQARAIASGKRVQALGGAKNHAVVMPDADFDGAVDGIISAAFGSAGQRCMAVSVVVAVGSIQDALVAALAERARAIVVGAGTEPAAEMGPLISAAHRERVRQHVDVAEIDGATIVVDGRDITVPGLEDGYFLGPTLLDDVDRDWGIYREEVFGPVLVVLRAETYAEAIDIVNTSPYGNGAVVFTTDGGTAHAFGRDVMAGMVGVNVAIPVPMAYYSFGGWKDSLFGDLHVHGPDGIRFYTRGKVIATRWPRPSQHTFSMAFPVSD